MKPLKKVSLFTVTAICLLLAPLLSGCATPNPAAGTVTVTTNPTNGVSTTNVAPAYLPNQTVTSVVGTASQIAPLVPAPYGTILSGLLGLTTLVAGGIAAYKNNQASGLNAQLGAVIQGVQSATSAADGTTLTTPIAPASVKAAIQARATAAGVQPALDANVQKLTS